MYSQKPISEKQIAVLIDLENVSLSYIQHLFDQISQCGRIVVKRAYADWSRASKSRTSFLSWVYSLFNYSSQLPAERIE